MNWIVINVVVLSLVSVFTIIHLLNRKEAKSPKTGIRAQYLVFEGHGLSGLALDNVQVVVGGKNIMHEKSSLLSSCHLDRCKKWAPRNSVDRASNGQINHSLEINLGSVVTIEKIIIPGNSGVYLLLLDNDKNIVDVYTIDETNEITEICLQ
jgi:hypothetical protein